MTDWVKTLDKMEETSRETCSCLPFVGPGNLCSSCIASITLPFAMVKHGRQLITAAKHQSTVCNKGHEPGYLVCADCMGALIVECSTQKALLQTALGSLVEMRAELIALTEIIKPFDLHWTTDQAAKVIKNVRTELSKGAD